MTHVIENTQSVARELTVAELDEAGGGLVPLFFAGGFAVGAALGYYLFVAP